MYIYISLWIVVGMELKMSLESISLTFPVTSRKSKRPLKGSVGATKLGAMPKLRPAQPPEQHGETASSSARPASSLPFPTAPVPFFSVRAQQMRDSILILHQGP